MRHPVGTIILKRHAAISKKLQRILDVFNFFNGSFNKFASVLSSDEVTLQIYFEILNERVLSLPSRCRTAVNAFPLA